MQNFNLLFSIETTTNSIEWIVDKLLGDEYNDNNNWIHKSEDGKK